VSLLPSFAANFLASKVLFGRRPGSARASGPAPVRDTAGSRR
jgi:hypothetical protein